MIRLYNSMTQSKETFVPRTPGRVGIYCCGPTVYNLVHIGNARPYVTFAVLRNWLRHRGYDVTLVENITDVDDKIINKANAENRTPAEVATEYTLAYHEDMGRLGESLRPDIEPLATETIPQIIDLCCTLVAAGHAYATDGSVYFRVRGFKDYGKLSGQRIEELEQGARVTSEPGKEDPLDFAVWKAAKPGEPAWESPWGMGRPGWHIECSAMGLRYLGPGFDIHGGGRDLIFPHHENEIAQSEAAGLPFARTWMHNGMIRSEGEKMAKSVGNIFLLREVLDRYADPAFGDAPVVMMYFLTTHYRSPLEFSLTKLDEAKASYDRLAGLVCDLDFRLERADAAPNLGEASDIAAAVERAREAFSESMDDDMNTAAALGELFGLVGEMYRYLGRVDAGEAPLDVTAVNAARSTVVDLAGLLLVRLPAAGTVAGTGALTTASIQVTGAGAITTLDVESLIEGGRWGEIEAAYVDRLAQNDATYAVALRDHYRALKNWAKSDQLRDELQAAGFEVRDTKLGTQVVARG